MFSADQASVVRYVVKNPSINVLVHGRAGVGKSFVRDTCIEACTGTKTIVVGPTGLSIDTLPAKVEYKFTLSRFLCAKGSTLGDVALLGQRLAVPTSVLQRSQIFIEEAGMLSAAEFTALHRALVRTLGVHKPFGGVRLVLFCDLLQLRPVNNKFFWETTAFYEMDPNLVMFELTVNHRINDADPEAGEELENFLSALRTHTFHKNGRATAMMVYFFNYRKCPEDVLRLCSTNKLADEYNTARLEAWPGSMYVLVAKHNNKATVQREEIYIKRGVRVQVTRNIYSADGKMLAVNGSFGTFLDFHFEGKHVEDEPMLEQDTTTRLKCKKNTQWRLRLDINGKELDLSPYEFTDHDNETKKRLATIYQYPIQVAFAVTIHRVQGQTLNAVCVDGRELFDSQQMYTACSRVRTLHGLYCKDVSVVELQETPIDDRIVQFMQANNLSIL